MQSSKTATLYQTAALRRRPTELSSASADFTTCHEIPHRQWQENLLVQGEPRQLVFGGSYIVPFTVKKHYQQL
ncbi:hypothetical protein FVB03_26855 [Escherichia coli]|uniref:hypothetical protein n=1 Tax=Escherichia coli TaxID=562 RepID=UPI00128DE04D|nr:hypothetical protein [Escherichia coli]MPU87938.1 hypothetical protein [Escherichia coli]